MPDSENDAQDTERLLAEAHSRSITKWLLDSRRAPGEAPPKEEDLPKREAA